MTTNDALTMDEERRLIEACLAGDIDAWLPLVEAYKDKVMTLCYRILRSMDDAEDMVQDTFIVAYNKLHQHDSRKRFSSWILKIAQNGCFQFLKKKGRGATLVEDERILDVSAQEGDASSTAGQPEAIVETKQLAGALDEAINEIPQIYSSVLTQRYVLKMSYQEIAEVQEIPIGTVRSRLNYAHGLLRNLLVKKEWGPA